MGTNTGIGIGIGIPFKNNALGGDRPYLPPELKARLIGVWDNYGKKNTDADRNIIKNKIPNAGGDLEILNAAYEGMSGYNGYPVIFGINKTWKKVPTYNSIYNINDNKIHFTKILVANNGLIFSYVKQNDQLLDKREIPSFKIRISGLEGDSKIRYSYIKTENAVYQTLLDLDNGIHELPKSLAPTDSISNNSWIGFTITPRIENETDFDCDITIEILPEYEGAFVTDGVNDIIVSQNTVEEMGITDEVTVVSMIHQIDLNSTYTIATTNYIENSNSREHVRSDVYNYGKTGIYGYSASLINNTKSDIKNILGDKADYYVKSTNSLQTIFDAKFSVVGRISQLTEASQVAWYWTFIAKGLLTTDEINQVIAYYNLDKYVKPDIYYDVKKQGLTNDNHAQFGDKLIDYSGNSRDLQLFNIGWKGESGVGRYTEEFKNDYWLVHKDQTGIIKDGNSIKVVGKLSNYYIVYHSRLKATNGFKVKIKGIKTEIVYSYISSDKEQSISFKEDGIYDIPASEAVDSTFTLGFYFRFDDINLDWIGLTIEIIPSNKGALCLDGINDFGKVINMPIYKDYTFIVDREILSIDNIGIIASKSESAEDATKHGAFIFEYLTAPNIINTWSYYKNNTNIANTDFIRGISYQSKYNYNGKDLIIGTSKDSDKLYLGTIRDNSDKYGNIAIYFLMSFPYSMNKFLIERQLKKYKAGTLYKDMVEFRPVIKSNIDIKNIVYLDKDSNVVKVGDYISIGSNIKTSITVLDGYKISKVSSTAFNNITIEKSNTDFIYDVIFYGIKKSPQKINLVIEQDSDYVQWNPNIKANVSKYSVTANIRETDGTTLKLVNGQFYSTSITGNLILDIVPPYKDSDEVTNVVIDGKSYVPTKDSSGNYYRLEIPLVFPKEINITIQEYVRYEDIVQPYPVLLRFKDENNNEISWGDKIKLGSSITRIGLFNDCNLLKDIYTVSNAKLNGNPLTSTPHVVERQMVFTCTATWIFDDNEPNCILSPRLLHAPNSSYKILGHIPDISGHGNHGVIYNSAYKLNSGANGYLVDFTTLRDYGTKGIVRTDSKIYLDESFDYDNGFWLGYTNSPSPTYKVRVSGIPKDGVLNYTGGSWINLINGINELPARTNIKEIHGFFAQTPNVDWSNLVIEQIGEYEGAYCLDGIDDFITIPTLSKGGKQVLMKVNWSTLNGFIYDQRPASGDKTFGIYAQGDVIAYSQNNNGNTYIDGIINNNIIGSNLSKITHNIVATCDVDNSITPSIGKLSYSNSYFAQMSLYDFMLFDEISTDDKIKELNTYIGITPKVTLPNYYWDNYGKKNIDAKRGYIDEQVSLQKTGTSVNPLENFNIGYEGMSGYNGYPVVLGANKTWETSNAIDYIYDINSTIVHITNVKHAANGLLYSYVKKDGALANIKEIPAFRVTVKGLEENSKLIYKYLATENATKESIVYLGNGIHKLPKSFVPTDALLDLTTNSWIGFAITPMIEGELVFDCDITIEILPEYENGLVYDGVSDFTDNKNIPIFTDFTAIIKRVDLDAKNDNSTVMFKGNKIYESSIGNGFILDYCYNSKNYVYSYGKLNQIERDDSKIIYLTPESYNGNPIIKGENEDNLGLVLGKYWKGIIYKTILYSKTISLLEINFLKNLMEKDEIIDINHPIFISNTENESNTSQDT
jgi:hypothetical protein